jgi:hypothetical protein
MIQFAKDVHLIQQNLRVFYEGFVYNLDNTIGIRRLLQFSFENCAVPSSADGLDRMRFTFG